MILKDPAVAEPVVVHRRRRHQHHAQQRPHLDHPEAARRAAARAPATSSRGCSRRWREVDGITLYMQPVQDLHGRGPRQPHAVPVHARGRRTPTSSRAWAPRLRRARCSALPELRDVASDQQDQGPRRRTLDDRPRHRRRGSASRPQAIDDTLYDAFGQRQVSTIFTQLNQYRVVLEVKPEFQQDPDALEQHLRARRRTAAQVPLSSAFTQLARARGAARRSTTRASSRR